MFREQQAESTYIDRVIIHEECYITYIQDIKLHATENLTCWLSICSFAFKNNNLLKRLQDRAYLLGQLECCDDSEKDYLKKKILNAD